MSTFHNPTRRALLSGIAASGALAMNANFMAAHAAKAVVVAAKPQIKWEVLEIGPGKRFPSITLAGAYMNSIPKWNNGYAGPDVVSRMGFHLIISSGPAGYYTNDSGSHSRRWPSLIGWPAWDGCLLGPTIIEGEPGKPPVVLATDGFGDGVLYYQSGLYATGSCDATFRNIIFKGFKRQDGQGNYAAVRLGQTMAGIPMNSQVLFEDCEFTDCDNGIMGGAVGQSLTLRRCYFHDNGNWTGRVHNCYFSAGDVLTVEDTLSTRCTVGHLMKSRAAQTIIRNSRFIGNGGTESSCLDVPNAGILNIDGLVCEKSPGTDANWVMHYSGENQDQGNGIPFHQPSRIKIDHLTMIAPASMTRHPDWGPILGLANQSGLGESYSGKGSHFIQPHSLHTQVYGLTKQTAGLPAKILVKKPLLDLSSPVGKVKV